MEQSYFTKPASDNSRKSRSTKYDIRPEVDGASANHIHTSALITSSKNFNVREVIALVGGSKATHYNRLNRNSPYFDPHYPKPIKNGRLSIYLANEVQAYLSRRVTARDKDP